VVAHVVRAHCYSQHSGARYISSESTSEGREIIEPRDMSDIFTRSQAVTSEQYTVRSHGEHASNTEEEESVFPPVGESAYSNRTLPHEEFQRAFDERMFSRPRRSPSHDQGPTVRLHHQTVREYLSSQGQPHPPSDTRFSDDELLIYIDENGDEVECIRGDPLDSYPQPSRYDGERYNYSPVPYKRPAPHRQTTHGETIRSIDKERRRSHPISEFEPEAYRLASPETTAEEERHEEVPVPHE
jgi:hypothetical protein